MAPLQAFLALPAKLRPAEEVSAVFWLVNDLPQPFHDLTLAWTIADRRTGGIVSNGEFSCSIDMNGIAQVGSLRWTPETCGDFAAALQLFQGGRRLAENSYRLHVGAESESTV